MKDEQAFIRKAKEILEMQLEAENLRKTLGQSYNIYFVEKAETALRCLEEEK